VNPRNFGEIFDKKHEAPKAGNNQNLGMTTQTKILLAISLTGFALSPGGWAWGLFLPIGAVFFGLFLISNLLGKEAALFDEEQRMRIELAEGDLPRNPTSATKSSSSNPALKARHA